MIEYHIEELRTIGKILKAVSELPDDERPDWLRLSPYDVEVAREHSYQIQTFIDYRYRTEDNFILLEHAKD